MLIITSLTSSSIQHAPSFRRSPSSSLCLRHIAHARRRSAHRHARLQVVDAVGDEGDEDEEDQDDEEDDDVALHFGGVWSVGGCEDVSLCGIEGDG
jgi:hypothetical protein